MQHLLDAFRHRFDKDEQRMLKCNVLHFLDKCIEDFAYGTLVLILPLIHGQKHVACEYDGYMCSQCIIGKTVAFRPELEK